MNRPETFERSVRVLTQAFLKGTLAGGHCAACAVGNLVADRKGFALEPFIRQGGLSFRAKGGDIGMWSNIFCGGEIKVPLSPDGEVDWKYYNHDFYEEEVGAVKRGLTEIEELPYTIEELAEIEGTFEMAGRIPICLYPLQGHTEIAEIIEDQYDRLVAVFKVLQQIHEVEEEGVVEAAIEGLHAHPLSPTPLPA